MKLCRCVVEIKMKAQFEDGCGLKIGLQIGGVGCREKAISPAS